MRPTDLFIRRPVLAIVVNLVILIAGLWSASSLSVRQYPRSDIAVIRVSTAYIGASADLVRGFITTPLERVIASADGIDYLESSSAQGLSAITVHLKLNYDTSAALTQIQAKVAQVRNDLPPEAEAPIIELETADSQFAAMYIGFASDELDQNQITDYLTRVVQPRLSAIGGVQRADILGDRTFAMRVWLKADKMAALGIAPSEVHDALSRNNYLSALGRTKGSMVSVNLVANTDLQTPEEFRSAGGQGEGRGGRPPGRDRGRGARGRELRRGRPVRRPDRHLHGDLGPPLGELARRDEAGAQGDEGHRGGAARGHARGDPLRLDRLHPGRARRGAEDADRDAPHRGGGHLPVPGLLPGRPHPGGRHPDLAPRGGLPHDGGGLHHQPAHAAGRRALGRAGGGRRDRHGRERRAPPGRGQAAPGGGARGRAGARGADRGHDDHARGRLHAGGDPGRPHRGSLPRVRLHAGGGRHRVRGRGPDPVAHDGLPAPPHRATPRAGSPGG